MARPSMGQLIDRVRTLIADPTAVTFTDDAVQDALDVHRVERRWVPLRPQPTFLPGGAITYLDYYSDAEYWESDVQLQNLSYQTITPTVSELLVGHWSFAVQPDGIGVRATGKTYDIYAGAADLLEAWAATVKLDFTFVNGKNQYLRNQKFQMLSQLAADYRKRAMPHVGRLVQSDAAPDHEGGGVVYPDMGGITEGT